jgi:hypothetical protein
MAKSAAKPVQEVDTEEIDTSLVTTAPDEWEWDTVAEESPTGIVFEKPGEVFIGQYLGTMDIDPDNGKDEPFTVFLFLGRDGNRYSLNQSYKLAQAMNAVDKGQWCRVTYTKDIPTGRGLNPLKDFRVDVKR